MQSLRNAHLLARFVLVWFVLFIGVSVASPLVHPQTSQMVCTAMGGMKLTASDEGSGNLVKQSGSLDCPLCAQLNVPISPVVIRFDAASALAHALHPIALAHIALLTGSPLPPRGPPTLIVS